VRDALLRQKEELSKSKVEFWKNAWCSLPSKIHNHCFITMNRFGAMTKSVVIWLPECTVTQSEVVSVWVMFLAKTVWAWICWNRVFTTNS